MSVRSFSVFQDSPADPVPKSPSFSATAVVGDDSALPASASTPLEKENLHPVTGIPTTSSSQPSKKRKASTAGVLATKLHIVPAEDSAPGKGKKPDMKHRKSSSSSTTKAKGLSTSGKKTKKDRERKVLGQSVNGAPSIGHSQDDPASSSGVSSRRRLEVVAEQEDTESVPTTRIIAQAMIDSRCYDLTVSPLADVSTAYLQSSESTRSSSNIPEEKLTEIRTVKETGFEAQMRDYFSPTHSQSSSCSSRSAGPKVKHNPGFTVFRDDEAGTSTPAKKARIEDEDEKSTAPLSTPVRKEIYASFTFSSPIRSPGL